VAHTYNPRTLGIEAGGLQIQGQSILHTEFQASLSYKVKACLTKLKTKQNNISLEIFSNFLAIRNIKFQIIYLVPILLL
jgi:hypothetical protein